MKAAQIVVLTIAVGAGGVAAYLASGSGSKPAAPAAAPVAQIETTDVLVAKNDIPLGQAVTAADLQWHSWPASAASASFIQRSTRPDATTQMIGSIVRSAFLAGEPIRETKLVKSNGSGFMAAILPGGMRAVSTEISAETGAGGFILPNDRVDVLLTKRQKSGDSDKGAPDIITSEIVLNGVRVLAIDQTIEEKNGQKVVVGKTATLELKSAQAETLARSRQSGTLSLALRSLVDAGSPKSNDSNTDENTVIIYRGTHRESQNVTRETGG